MSRFEYSNHFVTDSENERIELPRLMYNAVFIKGVGLVAASDISDPYVIVVHGATKGNVEPKDYGFYDELVIAQPQKKSSIQIQGLLHIDYLLIMLSIKHLQPFVFKPTF
ncbi:uncharacterized protein TNIN_424481 [Trichonephila inaurata madagascariensis]|uniref:Uncharacterized protein n=1 Tax=Trichonephila inaurata madagascariensis TaxID=2747483 RepID=A0A8X7C4T5_9ARAC|nr:uncharacterized protein TNIN_424481 [Trichonephila inaurata madagascariensis]